MFFRARRREDVGAIREGLSLLCAIPHAARLEVVENGRLDEIGNEVDVIVYGEFADAAALAAYKAHPLYQESIHRVRPLREMRLAADFEAPD